jgi:SET and MYND domain-containing protein
MANFAELKATRDRSKAQRSFSSIQNSTGGIANADHNGAERKLVDSSDASESASDILGQPSPGFGQPKNTEIEADLGIYHSLPLGLEVRSTETRGRGLWSQNKRLAGLSFPP